MLWVGGAIIIHGLEDFGLSSIGHFVEDLGARVRELTTVASGLLGWATEASLSGLFGLAIGLVALMLMSVGTRVTASFRTG